MKKIITSLAMLLIISPVAAADIITLNQTTGTDWILWILSGLIGLFLFLYSLNVPSTEAENEIDLLVSIISWIPIGFCAWASSNVSRVIGPGTITLYSFPVIFIIMAIFTAVAIGNTIRIISLFKMFKMPDGQNETQIKMPDHRYIDNLEKDKSIPKDKEE